MPQQHLGTSSAPGALRRWVILALDVVVLGCPGAREPAAPDVWIQAHSDPTFQCRLPSRFGEHANTIHVQATIEPVERTIARVSSGTPSRTSAAVEELQTKQAEMTEKINLLMYRCVDQALCLIAIGARNR